VTVLPIPSQQGSHHRCDLSLLTWTLVTWLCSCLSAPLWEMLCLLPLCCLGGCPTPSERMAGGPRLLRAGLGIALQDTSVMQSLIHSADS
jgi:hypothetical protein